MINQSALRGAGRSRDSPPHPRVRWRWVCMVCSCMHLICMYMQYTCAAGRQCSAYSSYVIRSCSILQHHHLRRYWWCFCLFLLLLAVSVRAMAASQASFRSEVAVRWRDEVRGWCHVGVVTTWEMWWWRHERVVTSWVMWWSSHGQCGHYTSCVTGMTTILELHQTRLVILRHSQQTGPTWALLWCCLISSSSTSGAQVMPECRPEFRPEFRLLLATWDNFSNRCPHAE